MADDEENTSSLHARIFGSDDDDDDEYVAPVEPVRKRIQKSKPSSNKKRKSAPDADEMAAAGREAEAQKAARRAEKDARRNAGDGEGAAGAAGDEDDPDEDSMDGDEAVEEGSKKDINRLFGKSRSGKKEYNRQQLQEMVAEMQEKMERAAEKDDDALAADPPRPAVFKAAMMPEVFEFMRKKHFHEVIVDVGVLTTMSRWLTPTKDGALVNLTVRTGLLKCLNMIDADDTLIGALRTSKIGVYVKLLSIHRKETDENKRAARALVEKWKRPIFNSNVAFRSQEVESVLPRFSAAELAAKAEEEVKAAGPSAVAPREHRSGGVTKHGTVVPRPLGMDFHAQPASSAQPTASAKYTKESTKGKLQERIIGAKKGKTSSRQYTTLSVEGRTLDRV